MNPYYNQKYTKEDIDMVLVTIKECVRNNKYTIAMNENRQENIEFINEYNLRSDIQKSILLNLNVNDFCYTLQNKRIGYEYEVLYVFVPRVSLNNVDGIIEMVKIYIKVNIIEKHNGMQVVVISFHKCNKPIEYLFK